MPKRRVPGEPSRYVDMLSPRARRLLALALFLTFAPLLVVPIESEGYRLGSVVFISLVSGVMGACYGLAFMWSIRLLPVALGLHVLTFFGFGGAFPAWLWPPASGFSLTGIAAVVTVAAAYVVFVVIIAGEGQRSVRQRAELDLATRIHQELTPPIDAGGAWGRAVGISEASNSMGGDLIDVVEHGDSADVILADVSGHGVRAGVVMAMLKTAFRGAADGSNGPGRIAEAVNAALVSLTAGDVFATAWLLRFERGGRVSAVGCGHPPLFRVRVEGAIDRIESGSMPMGVADGASFEAVRLELSPGERLVVYSDGLTEAGVEQGAMIGVDGLESIVRDALTRDAEGLPDAVVAGVRTSATTEDDLSILVLETGGAGA